MSIFSNFIPSKCITFDNRDSPWMNFVKTKIRFKNRLCNTYIKNSKEDNDYNMLQEAIMKFLKLLEKERGVSLLHSLKIK